MANNPPRGAASGIEGERGKSIVLKPKKSRRVLEIESGKWRRVAGSSKSTKLKTRTTTTLYLLRQRFGGRCPVYPGGSANLLAIITL